MILFVESNWHFCVYYCSWSQWFLSKVGDCKGLRDSKFDRIIDTAELKQVYESATSKDDDGKQIMSQQAPFEEGHFLTPEEVARIEARKQAAIRAAQETPGTCTKHVRLSIDFRITIAGTPPDDDGLNEPDPVYHARQARVLAAVKSNQAVLKQWMYELIVSQMHQKGWSDWNMLTPALAALSEDDQAYFAEGATGGSFEDLLDLFSASFTITEDAPVITNQGEEV